MWWPVPGSIVYGEYQGGKARAGGWGELFSDEGSAHWIAREGLSVFSRMSDGRDARGTRSISKVRAHFKLDEDLDLCAAILWRRCDATQPVFTAGEASGDCGCERR